MSDGAFPSLGIPRWDQPLQEEHPAGLMLRLAELNRFRSVTTVERETGISMSDMKTGQGLDRLARLVDCHEGQLEANAYIHGIGSKVTIRGQQVSPKRDLRRIHRRVCMACLAESPHARFWWDLTFLASCPRHGWALENRCGCARRTPLSWTDGRVGACKACDEPADAVPAVLTSASKAILAVDGYLLGRLDAAPATPSPLLDALPLYEAVDVLERLGALSLGGFSVRWQTARTLDASWNELLAEGYALLADGSLPTVLDRVFAAGAAAGAAPTLTTAYGWFYHWLNGKGGRAFSEALLRLVVEHAEARFIVDKRARTALLPPSGTCTFIEATRRCGVSKGVMRDILIQKGLSDPARELGRPIRIPEAEIRAIEAVMWDSVDAQGAAALLDTGRKVVNDLIALGILKPWVAGGRSTKHAYIFRRADVQGVLDRLSVGLPERPCVAQDEITLTDAGRDYAVTLAVLCREALEGRLALVGLIATGRGLRGLVVRRAEVLGVRRRLKTLSR